MFHTHLLGLFSSNLCGYMLKCLVKAHNINFQNCAEMFIKYKDKEKYLHYKLFSEGIRI
jgi:hypothetical protein